VKRLQEHEQKTIPVIKKYEKLHGLTRLHFPNLLECRDDGFAVGFSWSRVRTQNQGCRRILTSVCAATR